MATHDGDVDRQGEDAGARARASKPRPIADEPDLLPADWPGPVTWGAPIGAGGEVLADASDLVPLAGSAQPEETPALNRPGRRPRRSPGRPKRSEAEGGDSQRRRPSMRVPSVGVLAATAAIAGLMSLAGVFLLVLFSTGEVPSRDHDNRAAARLPAPQMLLSLPDLAMIYRPLKASPARALEGRRRDQVHKPPQPARQGTQDRKSVPSAGAGESTVRVASPSPATHSTPTPVQTVPPAVREFTPGPWNLS